MIRPQIGLIPIGRNGDSGLWEFSHLQTGVPPEPSPDPQGDNRWRLTADTGLIFVLIPGGTFWMGVQGESPQEPNYCPDPRPEDSGPNSITLDPFFISKYEMTQGQWLRFAGENPSYFGPGFRGEEEMTLLHPVDQVSWDDCHRVLERLRLVLPTEAQLEFAVRGGSRDRWFTGTSSGDSSRGREPGGCHG